ncbi:MAG: hypothetical protein Q9200_002034 [Gallowayella weberi]
MGLPISIAPPECEPCIKLALSVINQEVGFYKLLPDGSAPVAAMKCPHHHLVDLLRGLKWRAQIQVAVWETFRHLCSVDLCTKTSLAYQVCYLEKTSEDLKFVLKALKCFPIFDELTKSGQEVAHIKDKAADWKSFTAPLQWLAIMLVRGSRDITETIREIETCNILGQMDPNRRRRLGKTPLTRPWKRQADQSITCFETSHSWSMMLPVGINFTKAGVTLDSVGDAFYKRIDSILVAYGSCLMNPYAHCIQHTESDHQGDQPGQLVE